MTDNFALVFQTLRRKSLAATTSYEVEFPLLVTRHPLHHTKDGGILIGAGQRVHDQDLEDMKALLDEQTADEGEGWLEESLLYRTRREMVWWVPGRVRPMHFRPQGNNRSMVLRIHWPGLIFRFRMDQGLRVVAYARSGRPGPDTRLYHAPLWNIDEMGAVCLGSAIGGRGLSAHARRQWEGAVFDSAFSHPNHDRVIRFDRRSAKNRFGSYLKFIQSKHRSGAPFRAKEMVPFGMNLEQWLA